MNASSLQAEEISPEASLALARHQRRREQGVPTLTVLVGAPEPAVALWRVWAESSGWKPVVVAIPSGPNGEPGGLPGTGREDRSPDEAVLYLATEPVGTGTGTGTDAAEAKGRAESLAENVARLCRRLDAPAAGSGGTNWPFGLAVNASDAATYLRGEPYSRHRALFAEGIIHLPERSGTARFASPEPALAAGEGASPVPGMGALAGNVLRAETAASLDAARASLREAAFAPADDPEAGDRARSAAERFLFHLLADLPETAGLFELNGKLDFCFGPMLAEVDLLARGLRLAVEIDGFHHFREADGYRRDRRKDALLQRQGYFVLRFLAEDVVVRLEEILEEIRLTVASRRVRSGGPEA